MNETKPINYRPTVMSCRLSGFIQAVTINLAPVLFTVFNTRYGVSLEQLGRLVLICFVTQLIVDALSIKLADRLGYRFCSVLCSVVITVGLVALGVLPLILPRALVYGGLCAAVIVYSIGSGIIEVMVSPIVDRIPSDTREADLLYLHAFYCWGQLATVLLSTLLLFVVGQDRWYILPILWAILPCINIFRFATVPMPEPVPAEKRTPVRRLLVMPVVIGAILMMIAAGAAELAMSQWSSLFAERALGITKVAGDLLGPCLFALTMGIGRTIYGIIGEKRIKMNIALTGCSVLTIVCYAAAALSPWPWLSLVACSLCGLGVSIMWPGSLYRASDSCPTGGTAVFAICALAGDAGCSLGPYVTGLVAELLPEYGLRAGLLAASVFPILMIIGCLKKRK